MNVKVRNIREDLQDATIIADLAINMAVDRTTMLGFHSILTMMFIEKLAEINIREYRNKIINQDTPGFDNAAKEAFLNKLQGLVNDVIKETDELSDKMVAAGKNPQSQKEVQDFLNQTENDLEPPPPSCKICNSLYVGSDGLCNLCRA